jgi:Zn-dependent peptidase ImmA (M78 family)/transcriptional regulator with XRE-family HTH domain
MPRSEEIELAPNVLRWARERASMSNEQLGRKVGLVSDRIATWEATGRLTLSQVEKLARATYTPYGYLFLDAPLQERIDLPDFRAVRDNAPETPSPELLDVLHEAESRQAWYRGYLLSIEAAPVDFVGSLSIDTPVFEAEARIRTRVGISIDDRLRADSWERALSLDMDRFENAHVLVMRTGIVGSNTRRPLSVDEFRGFAIADTIAPLIFINGRDAKAAQMFTLMHELVHLWIGRSAISNLDKTLPSGDGAERFCNAVAAELLVPSGPFRERVALEGSITDVVVTRLTRAFKVSSLVILRRLRDIGRLNWDQFRAMYVEAEARYRDRESTGAGGGNFYATQAVRVSKPFLSAIVADTIAGNTTRRDAYRLLGIRSESTFDTLAQRLGIPI